MKLLIDQNLSYRLVKQLQELFPGTEQVQRLGLTDHRDALIWEYAQREGFVILTQDEDFLDLSLLRGSPPKVLLLRTGNLPSTQVVDLLQNHQLMIYTSLAPESEVNCLQLV
jgi:predicted nuclease of predicted toxin-antitoxin system